MRTLRAFASFARVACCKRLSGLLTLGAAFIPKPDVGSANDWGLETRYPTLAMRRRIGWISTEANRGSGSTLGR